MNAPRRYVEELRSELGAYATWLPTDPVELGSFGRIVDGHLVVEGRLADLDIPIEPTTPLPGQAFRKQRGMKFHAGSTTSVTSGAVDLGVDISFEAGSTYAWAFAASGASKTEIKNIFEVNRLVVEAYKAGRWEGRWLLVTGVWRVERFTLLVARSKNVTARAHAQGVVADPLDLLLEESASVQYKNEDFFCVKGAKGVTPLYALRKLKGWLGKDLRGISGGVEPSDPSLEAADDEPLFE